MSMSLANKVCLITGASAGIGMATSIAFAKLGAHLALCGRNLEGLQSTAKQCSEVAKKAENDFILLLQADLGIAADRERIISQTIKHFDGRLDVLVNNAGAWPAAVDCANAKVMESYDGCFELNVKAPLHLTHLAIPYLAKGPGAIVNIGSICGSSAIPGRIAYSMSKAAVHHMTACMALELAPKGIRVNCVSPALTKTELLRRSGMDDAQREEMYKKTAEIHPLGRAGEPEEVADSIAFFASDASRFTTGVVFPVDGGRHATCLR